VGGGGIDDDDAVDEDVGAGDDVGDKVEVDTGGKAEIAARTLTASSRIVAICCWCGGPESRFEDRCLPTVEDDRDEDVVRCDRDVCEWVCEWVWVREEGREWRDDRGEPERELRLRSSVYDWRYDISTTV
jgi:hypothetical protein